MKKLLIPFLSLLFIISLDSCKKDSDKQAAEEATRVVKASYTSKTSPIPETTIFEYDNSGRVISLKDSSDPTYSATISYVGDEAIFQEASPSTDHYTYMARYKLNSNHLPVQRITVETEDRMSADNPSYQYTADTCKFEYDAAGLLTKGNGTGYDTSWSKYSQSVYFGATRKSYTINYTNTNGKLTAVKINGVENANNSVNGPGTMTTVDDYTFEYNNNYANKTDSINAWLFIELGSWYGEKYPTIKYAYLYDKINHSFTRTDVASGYVTNYTSTPETIAVEYLPSGYISTITYGTTSYWDKARFTYNK